MICRICRTEGHVHEYGRIQPYVDFSCMVYHCDHCGGRFTPRDESVYETLHSNSASSYAYHRDFAARAAKAFRAEDRDQLYRVLAAFPKNRFVMDTLDDLPPQSNMLEIGCSRGYLTSYFLLRGHNVLGSDVSESAVAGATEHFGPHFCVADSELVDERAPFDVIYHVGTIGCTEGPLDLTDRLVRLLKPGGRLVFNAPNVQAAEWQELAWVRGTYPPDLVCLFHPDIWQQVYGDRCDVEVVVERVPLSQSLEDARAKGRECVAAGSFTGTEKPNPLGGSQSTTSVLGRKARYLVQRAVNKLTPAASGFCRPSDFGLYVVMRKHKMA